MINIWGGDRTEGEGREDGWEGTWHNRVPSPRGGLSRGLKEAREPGPGDDRRQNFQTDLLVCFWLKMQKSEDEPPFSFRAIELIPWERRQDFEGRLGQRSERGGTLGRKLDLNTVLATGSEPTRTWKVGY